MADKIENRMEDCGKGRHVGWWSETLLHPTHLLVEVMPATVTFCCCEGSDAQKRISFIVLREKAVEIAKALNKALDL